MPCSRRETGLRRMPRARALLLAAFCIFLVAPAPASARILRVVASFTVLADVVREVGGEHVAVKSLVGPNGDPHEFSPTPDDARALKEADVSFVSGEGLEGWFQRLAEAAGAKARPVVASAGIATFEVDEDGRRATDPHVWNDAANVVAWVANIEAALEAADPEDAPAFKANAARYAAELQALDADARGRIAAIPQERRRVLTSHAAFGYFARAYGVTFLAPGGVSTEAEPSARGIAAMISQIRQAGVKVYFIENSNDPRLVKQVARATGALPGGELFAESLSPPDGPAPTYAKMVRRNVDLMVEAMVK